MLVLDNSTIKAVIDEYAKSEIQSEAEVRSKLVVAEFLHYYTKDLKPGESRTLEFL